MRPRIRQNGRPGVPNPTPVRDYMRFPGKIVLMLFLAAFGAMAAGPPAAPVGPVAPAASQGQAKRIVVFYDEDKDNFPGLATIDRGLREAFRGEGGKPVEIHSESLGLSRSADSAYEQLLAAYYRAKYAGFPPDLVVAVLEPPLDFLRRHGDAIFPGVPVVFSGLDAAAVEAKHLPANFTGVLLKRDYAPTLEIALRLQPDTRNVFVVSGGADYDRYLQGFVRRDLARFEGRVAVDWLFNLAMDDLLQRLSHLPPHSIVLYVTVFADATGRRFVPHQALAAIAARANAPVYVFLDQFLGLGSVGGNVYSTDALGAQVAALGREILEGRPPASLPMRAPDAQLDMFDARALRHWHLDPSRLPPGSVVRYEERSVWELYRGYIVAAAAVLLMQGALIAGLLVARRRQRRAEAEARRQRDDLAHVLRVTTLGELTSSLAHEINQPLGAILLNAEAAIQFLASGRPADATQAREALTDIVASAGHAGHVIARLRMLFRKERMEPVAVDVRSLVDNVVHLLHAAMLIERIGLRVVMDESVPAVFGDPVQLEQVLLNVVRNACDAIGAQGESPRRIMIHARRNGPGHVMIEVSDTGAGVKGDQLERIFQQFVSTKPDGLGMGLAISRSIIDAHGGLIWASANSDRGLTVHIELVACESDALREVRALRDVTARRARRPAALS